MRALLINREDSVTPDFSAGGQRSRHHGARGLRPRPDTGSQRGKPTVTRGDGSGDVRCSRGQDLPPADRSWFDLQITNAILFPALVSALRTRTRRHGFEFPSAGCPLGNLTGAWGQRGWGRPRAPGPAEGPSHGRGAGRALAAPQLCPSPFSSEGVSFPRTV